ncbi:MAG: HupE/UreJ family protein [Bryobacterales bacterium]|nr:HupE/UreJ family protein [Bryobacterales bacterium]
MRIAFLLLLPVLLPAHDIPADVTVHAFLKPDADRLRLIVRVPLRSMRDTLFPEYRPGYLDIAALAPKLPDLATLWLGDFAALYEGETRLPRPTVAATQISMESDRSFASYEEALAHVRQPMPPNSANLVWNQVWFDVLLEYPIQSAQSRFSIHPGWRHLAASTTTVLRYVDPNGTVRAFQFHNDPGLVALDPRWHQAAWHFIQSGFEHILDGTDHLLFLLCLVIPFRRLRRLILVVTAFTLAHSITLFASAFDMAPDALWFPPLIETLIAASIVYMALENIAGAGNLHRRWMIAFSFGLVHGFGFSFALRETLQFAGSHLLTSLVCFNIGVELGQLLVLVLLIPVLNLLFTKVVTERMGTILLSAIVAHTAWHWMADRFDQLRQYTIPWPTWDAAFFVTAMRWTAALILLVMLLAASRRWLTMKDNAS